MNALALVRGGASIDVYGRRFAGRTHFLRQLRRHLEDDGWSVVSVSGVASLQNTALAALDIAGIVETGRGVSPSRAVVESLIELSRTRQVAILVDDWSALDEVSWGVLSAAHEIGGIPIVRTSIRRRDRRLTPTGLEASESPRMFAVELVPLRIDELEEVLVDQLGGPVDASVVSRVFAKSAGIVGLAVSMVDAARANGTLGVTDGMWTVNGDLWAPELARIVESYLSDLTPPEFDVLEALALVGVLDVEIARSTLDWDAIERLEDRALVRFYRSGNRTLLNLMPPLIAEYLVHERNIARRTRMAASLGESETLASLMFEPTAATRHLSALREPDAFFVRMVTEQSRAQRSVARAQWEQTLDCRSANRYLDLLNEQRADPAEIEAVLARTDASNGDTLTRARFRIQHAWWRAYGSNDLDGALDLLAAEQGGFAEYSRLFDVARVELLAHRRSIPDDFERVLDFSGDIPRAVANAVIECRAAMLLSLGRVADARRMLDRLAEGSSGTGVYVPRMLEGLLLIAEGELSAALEIADESFVEARDVLDVRALRAHAYLSTLCLVFMGRYREVEPLIDMVLALGEPPHFPRRLQTATLMAGAMVALRRGEGNTAVALGEGAEHFAAEMGLLPFGGWPEAQEMVAIEEDDEAADLLKREADDQWQRGGRLASMLSLLVAIELSPNEQWLQTLLDRAAHMDSALLQVQVEYSKALVARDSVRLRELVPDLQSIGMAGRAITAARRAALLEDVASASTNENPRAGVAAMSSAYDPFELHQVRARLSDREVEIARLVSQGLTNQQIAQRLLLSARTVENHVHRTLRKTGTARRSELRDVIREFDIR